MGFSTGGNSGGRFGGTPTALAEINVTPLVDVMLVLLIVFMISAPLMQQGVQIDLPKTQASTLNEVPDHVLITIDQKSQIRLGEQSLTLEALAAKLRAIAEVKPDTEVFVQADRTLPYGLIAKVMAVIKLAKISRLGLVTDPASPTNDAAGGAVGGAKH